MPTALACKGKDINAWRPAGDFGVAFRQALLDKTAYLTSTDAEKLFIAVGEVLERRTIVHKSAITEMRQLMGMAATATEPVRLGEVTRDFYRVCYAMFAESRSAIAFYRLSQEFLVVMTGSLLACAKTMSGIIDDKCLPVTLITLGQAGRLEYSPFSSLKLLLATDFPMDSGNRLTGMLGEALHDICEATGIKIDHEITPRNPEWRGNLAQWQQRLASESKKIKPTDWIDMLRLADQATLVSDKVRSDEFLGLCMQLFRKNRPLLSFAVSRIQKLTNGVGMLGRLRIEKKGDYCGQFNLFNHALLPLSSSVTALTLIMGGDAVGTPERIRKLLENQTVSLEQGELLLEAWHTLNELRLSREHELFPDWSKDASLYFDPESLSDAHMERFREALEIVALLQRHVAITYNFWEDQTAC